MVQKGGSERLVGRDDILALGDPVEVAGDAGDREHVRPLQAISSTSSLWNDDPLVESKI